MSRPPRRPVRFLVFGVAMAGVGLLAACGDGVQARDASDLTIPVPDLTVPTIAPSATTTTSAADDATTTTEADTTDTTDATAAGGDVPDPQAPGDLGDDEALDALADDCFDGDFSACDQLFFDSPVGSDYEAYGDSCGGRNEPAGLCVNVYGQG
jgi:hypothetical protein